MAIQKVGLVGGGKMSSEIFKLLLDTECEVVLYVRRADAAAVLEEELLKRLRRRAKKEGEDGVKAQARLNALKVSTELSALADCDLLIESVSEVASVKVEVLRQLDDMVKPGAIFTTNTSSLSPSWLSRHVKRPEYFAGLHFFFPVSLVRFVEIVAAEKTLPEIPAQLAEFVRTIGKTPVRVKKEVSAFLINRVLAAYYNEGAGIVGEGHWLPGEVDKAGRKIAMMGPCESLDYAGIDVVHNGWLYADEIWGEKDHILKQTRGLKNWPVMFGRLVADGRLGMKSGRGFYLWDGKRAQEDAEYIRQASSALADYHSAPKGDEAVLTERLWMSLVLEACLTLQRDIGTPEDIDASVKEILGLERGPLAWIEHVGRAEARARAEALAAVYGPRFEPLGILKA